MPYFSKIEYALPHKAQPGIRDNAYYFFRDVIITYSSYTCNGISNNPYGIQRIINTICVKVKSNTKNKFVLDYDNLFKSNVDDMTAGSVGTATIGFGSK